MKNAILMIDVALQLERERGLPPQDAIREACLLRLRPILMTTLAALLGALPLVLGDGRGLRAAAAARHRDRRRAARQPGADAVHDAGRVPVSRSPAVVGRRTPASGGRPAPAPSLRRCRTTGAADAGPPARSASFGCARGALLRSLSLRARHRATDFRGRGRPHRSRTLAWRAWCVRRHQAWEAAGRARVSSK